MRFVLNIIELYNFHLFSLLCKGRSSCWKYWKWCSYFENPYYHATIVDKKIIHFLVGSYCTLLFSRKEILKFSEVALVSVHCNCLICCIVIAWSYRPWNTANTAVDICLLVENSNKNTETICKSTNFFYQSFGCSKANFGPLTRRQPHSPHVNHSTISSRTRRPPGASFLVMRLGPKAWPGTSVGFEPEIFQFWV